MVLRWTAAGMPNAQRSFRRPKGYLPLESGLCQREPRERFGGRRSSDRTSASRGNEATKRSSPQAHVTSLPGFAEISYPDRLIGLAAMLCGDERHVLHVYATWN